jgi:hypothetical protein
MLSRIGELDGEGVDGDGWSGGCLRLRHVGEGGVNCRLDVLLYHLLEFFLLFWCYRGLEGRATIYNNSIEDLCIFSTTKQQRV